MARTYYSAALFAVYGKGDPGGMGGFGVLFWHDNEIDAHREAQRVNKAGGDCKVVPAPGGKLDFNITSAVLDYIRSR